MPKLIKEFTYGFDDVSLEPHHLSKIFSRKTDIETRSKMGDVNLTTPIIASPMADVCNDNVSIAISKAGGIGAIHRFNSITEQVLMIQKVTEQNLPVLAAVGTTDTCLERAVRCYNAGAFGIIVDVAFLNKRTVDMCNAIRKELPDIYLISGNVATGAGFRTGIECGLDAIRVGIGNGQACRTSRVTGVGIGLVTSLLECLEEKEHAMSYGKEVAIICDGGMDTGGSFAKAIACGADFGIMGRAFAGTYEGPGRGFADSLGRTRLNTQVPISDYEGHDIFKEYRGSASMEAQMVYKARGDIITSEGVASIVKVYGSVAEVLGRFNGALRSSMSYLGASNIQEFRNNAILRLVSTGTFNQQRARTLQTKEITI